MDHAVASIGVAERCCVRSTAYPGLVCGRGALIVRSDRRTVISDGVDMVLQRLAVGGLEGVRSYGG